MSLNRVTDWTLARAAQCAWLRHADRDVGACSVADECPVCVCKMLLLNVEFVRHELNDHREKLNAHREFLKDQKMLDDQKMLNDQVVVELK